MSRIFPFGNVKRATHSLLANRKAGFGEVVNGACCTDWFHYTLWRLHNCHAHSFRGYSPFLVHKVRHNLLKNSSSRNFSTLSASYTISYNAQVACKRLWQMCMHNGPALQPISRIACAVSVALTRSNLVAPGVIAFIIRELFSAQQTYAEAESSLLRDTLYTQTYNGHIYLTAFVLLVLDCIILLLRAVYLAILFLPCVAMVPFANSLGPRFRKSLLRVVHLTLEKAGPAFIKWGQWAAMRPDLFSQDLCTELSKLHSKAPAHSFSYTKKTVERAFGRKLPEIFSKFDEDPVASGSVAQVHRAILKYRYPGQEIEPVVVAVKV